ncbi:rhomboid family intramembrane serine protease [Flavobacterium sp. MFBS3-15]|uniref:rhomboid family intramembrane serine protease n=1 Tax=Flavobacterium sp. MFBS3-15 TaxID=2989816 RepID=UPI0022368EEC|nr:rhomboid family intramembrane serine protease [Flavobacterium sp. MFBS3-15]MCW4468540.1 rhomboid family intramembrane serine protease [Flavobacterium sp. MFBS3-15]
MNTDLVLIAVIAINAIVSYKGFNDEVFKRKYLFHIGSIRAGQQYRMFTSAFLHADMMHLVFNMITLFFFAPVVISVLGEVGFLMVYFISLFAGNLLTLYFHKNEYHYSALGASGAVVGVLFSSILLYPDMTINFFIPGYIYGIFYLLFSIYGMKSKRDNIGHTAHFGGAIGGYAITLARVPEILEYNTMVVILLALPIVILFVMAKMGKL